MQMQPIKKTVIIVMLFACIAYIVYKIGWRKCNVQTDGYLRETYNDTNSESLIESIQHTIDKQSELEIELSYDKTQDLRKLLIDNQIKATDNIKSKFLIPKNIVIPKVQPPTVNKSIQYLDTKKGIQQISSTLQQSKQMITNMPNWFDTTESVAVPDQWQK